MCSPAWVQSQVTSSWLNVFHVWRMIYYFRNLHTQRQTYTHLAEYQGVLLLFDLSGNGALPEDIE